MRHANVAGPALCLGVLLSGCGTGREPEPAPSVTGSSPSVSSGPRALEASAFADIREDPVPPDLAGDYQDALTEMRALAGGIGMSAAVMSADGTWTGASGKADGERDLRAEDQFAIASITKSVVAAQVMQMVEAGRLDLDDPADEHLPPDLGFDTNAATIRQLLGHRSGIPDYETDFLAKSATDPGRRWTPAEVLALVPATRAPAGQQFAYSSTNYFLLGLVIQHLSGRPVSSVLRDGVLGIDGVERLVHQPDEAPTEPMAMPGGGPSSLLDERGGFLPSFANTTGGGAAWAMASDAPSLAHWWRAFCSGEIVSQESLTEMTPRRDDYGLGLLEFPSVDAYAVGHAGWEPGYVSWAGCLPEHGAVIVVLSNGEVDDIRGMARPLILAVASRLG